MIVGRLNGKKFKLYFSPKFKIVAKDEFTNTFLGNLESNVFNPLSYETYKANIKDNELDAYLLIMSLIAFGFKVDIIKTGVKIPVKDGVIY